MDEYVEVLAASDITFAYLMKANLENAGIPVQITKDNLQGAYCLDGMLHVCSFPRAMSHKPSRSSRRFNTLHRTTMMTTRMRLTVRIES